MFPPFLIRKMTCSPPKMTCSPLFWYEKWLVPPLKMLVPPLKMLVQRVFFFIFFQKKSKMKGIHAPIHKKTHWFYRVLRYVEGVDAKMLNIIYIYNTHTIYILHIYTYIHIYIINNVFKMMFYYPPIPIPDDIELFWVYPPPPLWRGIPFTFWKNRQKKAKKRCWTSHF